MLLAPMPGQVVKVSVENGAYVEQGEPVLILNAMKMVRGYVVSLYALCHDYQIEGSYRVVH